jgi:DNA-directed RNA polymerase specialized sigma subunit
MVFAESLSQREIAQELDIAAATVCRRRKKLVASLTKALAARGIHEAF